MTQVCQGFKGCMLIASANFILLDTLKSFPERPKSVPWVFLDSLQIVDLG